MQVFCFKSEQFTSNTYLLRLGNYSSQAWLIDCGAFEPVLACIPPNMEVHGIFLTHYHYDHIYFINQWLERFPNLVVYCSGVTLEGLANPKKNLSFYHEDPISCKEVTSQILYENQKILLKDELELEVLETTGHCEGSLSFKVGKYIFTGDSLIPPIPVVTKLKTGNKEESKASLKKIKEWSTEEDWICPGHLEMISVNEIAWESYV